MPEQNQTNTQSGDKKEQWTPQYTPIVVNRNGIDLTFTSHQILKSKENKGKEYLAPDITPELVDTLLGWMSPDIAAKKLGQFMRMLSQNWWFDAVKDATDETTGKVDSEKVIETFIRLATGFSARGESIPQLKEQIDDLIDMISELDPTADDFATLAQQYSKEIKDLKLAISDKRRGKTEDEEKVAA